MKNSILVFLSAIFYAALPPGPVYSQESKDSTSIDSSGSSRGKELFGSTEVLEITLQGNMPLLLNDRTDKPKYFPMTLLYTEKGAELSIPVQVKTRGHFRRLRTNCDYPPLLVNFPKGNESRSALFKGQDKLKLVMPCKHDQYVILEWLAYQVYNLITPKSFKARLVNVRLTNTNKNKTSTPFYGILLESDKHMAKRNKAVLVNRKVQPQETATQDYLKMAVFEYLIGNTDWGVQYFQNIKLIAKDSISPPTAVPYDFDHAGLVNAPYALPAEELQMRSARQRRYRGFCLDDLSQYEAVIDSFNRKKTEVYDLFINCTLLEDKHRKPALKYLDDFYKTINNKKDWQHDFSYPCDINGTGNVVIKGLREQE